MFMLADENLSIPFICCCRMPTGVVPLGDHPSEDTVRLPPTQGADRLPQRRDQLSRFLYNNL